MQCTDCKARTSSPISHRKLTTHQKKYAPPFDQLGRLEVKNEIDHQYALRREQFNSAAWWRVYTSYLNSAEWKDKREKVLQRDEYLCVEHRRGCTRTATEVHHLTYKNVGNEPLEDLSSVCHHCHAEITKDSRREWVTL